MSCALMRQHYPQARPLGIVVLTHHRFIAMAASSVESKRPEVGRVAYWHEADIKLRPLFGRFGVESGHHRLVMSMSAKTRSGHRLCRGRCRVPALRLGVVYKLDNA
jgi:hypothetical protein